MTTEDILLNRYPKELVILLISYYRDIEENYRLEKWKPSELDAGHFVEVVRRIVENELFGTYPPVSGTLGRFDQAAMNKYERAKGDESFRIILPRVLFSMYCVRNKRGVGHLGPISPNKMDSTLILSSSKWVMAELTRLAGQGCPDEAHTSIDELLDKQVDLIWDDGDTFMILDPKMKVSDRVLLVLYKEDNIEIPLLRRRAEYSNATYFKKILREHEKNKLIQCTSSGKCKISPLGIKEVETRILKLG